MKLSHKQLKAIYMANYEKEQKLRKRFIRETGRTAAAKPYKRIANYIRFNCAEEYAEWREQNCQKKSK